MRKNKKIFLYMILFLVLIAQVTFASPISGNDAPEAAENRSAEDNLIMAVNGTVMASDSDMEQHNEPKISDVMAEEALIEPRIVYMNTLTSGGEIVDNLTVENDKSDFTNKLISYCEDRVNVYAEPDASSQVVGCMYSRSQADVIEKGEEWTKISSGNVVGYVKNSSMLFGEEADRVAPFLGTKTTVVEAESLPVYSSADVNSSVIFTFYAGDTITAHEEIGNWVLVECESGFGYVDENGISSSYDLDTAWTIDEEQAYLAEKARIEAQRIAEERAAAAKRAQEQSQDIGRTSNEPMYVSDEEIYLLACIIEWEAGWEPYEGKLAVANVVLNRVRSPRFSQNNITDVIYAPGQFTGVLDGNGNISERFSTLLANGPTHEECYTAAGEALAGVNNIGDYLFFISVKKANYARYTKYTILNNHCFYAY